MKLTPICIHHLSEMVLEVFISDTLDFGDLFSASKEPMPNLVAWMFRFTYVTCITKLCSSPSVMWLDITTNK